jgi:hypothetical protein
MTDRWGLSTLRGAPAEASERDCATSGPRHIGLRRPHNGRVACIHGNDPSTCSVCQTLADIDALTGTSGQGKGTGGRSRTRRADRGGGDRAGRVDIITGRGQPATRRSFGTHVAIFVVVLVLAAASVWIVSGIVFAFIRLLEIIVVAGVAGTLGYRLGHYRGRHEG